MERAISRKAKGRCADMLNDLISSPSRAFRQSTQGYGGRDLSFANESMPCDEPRPEKGAWRSSSDLWLSVPRHSWGIRITLMPFCGQWICPPLAPNQSGSSNPQRLHRVDGCCPPGRNDSGDGGRYGKRRGGRDHYGEIYAGDPIELRFYVAHAKHGDRRADQ
jgi:hypothetical protein